MYSCHLFLISSAFAKFLIISVLYCAQLCRKRSLGISRFFCLFVFKRSLVFAILLFFPLPPCIVHLKRLSYLSLLFSGTLHSVGYVFPFLPCLSLLPFSQLFVKLTHTATLLSCISFSLRWFGYHLLHNIMKSCP